jgi:hypothetical protein
MIEEKPQDVKEHHKRGVYYHPFVEYSKWKEG